MFEEASRKQLTYPSYVGELTTDQLWQLPLVGKEGRASLDSTARFISKELKQYEEESFVETDVNHRKKLMELRLDIVKYIIKVRLKEKEEIEQTIKNSERKQQLLAILATKEQSELMSLSKEELEAEIAKL